MDIIGKAIGGRANRNNRLKCRWLQKGGLQAVEAAQLMPIMPTRPVHQSCAASHWITVTASGNSCAVYSSVRIPSLSPVPRRSTRMAA